MQRHACCEIQFAGETGFADNSARTSVPDDAPDPAVGSCNPYNKDFSGNTPAQTPASRSAGVISMLSHLMIVRSPGNLFRKMPQAS